MSSGPGAAAVSGEEITKSIAEWQEERRRLGLKPLRIDDGEGNAAQGSSDAPLDHWQEKQKRDTERHDHKKDAENEKKKRERAKLATGKGLGDLLADDDNDIGAWAASHQKSASSRHQRDDTRRDRDRTRRRDEPASSSSNTTGLENFRVTHDMGDFEEGSTAILTLADERVLNADGTINEDMDMLEDINKTDAFKLKRREEQKKRKHDYDPSRGYHGDQNTGEILSKYDDLPTRAEGFTLGEGFSAAAEKRLAAMAANSADLNPDGPKFQVDMMNQQEEVVFRKKIAKQAKKRQAQAQKRSILDDEDDLGQPKKKMKFAWNADVDSDEDDPELYEQLRKQKTAADVRKKEEKRTKDTKEKNKYLSKGAEEAFVAEAPPESALVVSATTEFCKTVQTHEEKDNRTKKETFTGMSLFKQEQAQKLKLHEDVVLGQGATIANDATTMGSSSSSSSAGIKHGDATSSLAEQLHERPLDGSVSSALMYLRERNGFGKDQFNHHKREIVEGGVLEMDTQDGDVRIDYRDEFGRINTAKEQFRQISWNFHGKKHGGKNAERRKQRLEQENRVKKMDMSAPPTLKALQAVQKKDNKAYITLG
ncbi:unnamed protein product [Amoebophrya sp. A25]|nr:unnamed protein product [Amoebophrya sp. A25]|eukprot:GSA25T00016665001.1